MTTWTSYDENPCWHDDLPDWGETIGDDYDDEDLHVPGMCEYCGGEPWLRPSGGPHVDPFGRKVCCRSCFDQIIGYHQGWADGWGPAGRRGQPRSMRWLDNTNELR